VAAAAAIVAPVALVISARTASSLSASPSVRVGTTKKVSVARREIRTCEAIRGR
jgi:hypothetical protein